MEKDKTRPRRRLLLCTQGVPHESRGASTVIFWNYITRLRELDFDILNFLFIQADSFSQEEFQEYAGKLSEPGRFEVDVRKNCLTGKFTVR